MKTTLPIAFFLLLSLASFGQSNFERGYYVTSQGDSITSYIKNDDWTRNPVAIEVKANQESVAPQTLTLQQVKSFGFESGDRFETFTVNVDISPVDLNKIIANADPEFMRDTVMLRVLVKGPVNLYVYKDKSSKTHYYVSKGNEEPRELLYQKLKREDHTKDSYVTLELYKGMLSFYLAGCEKIQNKISATPFKQEALKELVLAHNNCMAPSSVMFKAKKEGIKTKVGIVAGFGMLSYKFTGDPYYDDFIEGNYNGTGISAGLALNFVLPRAHGRWTFVNELVVKSSSAGYHFEEIESETSYEIKDTDFKLLYVGLNNLLRYALTTGSKRPFVNFGFAHNRMVSDRSEVQGERSRYGIVRTIEESPLNDMRKLEQALLIGAGISTDKYAVEARAEVGTGFSPYTKLRSTKYAYSLQLSYFIR